jgi:hypothetical protein
MRTDITESSTTRGELADGMERERANRWLSKYLRQITQSHIGDNWSEARLQKQKFVEKIINYVWLYFLSYSLRLPLGHSILSWWSPLFCGSHPSDRKTWFIDVLAEKWCLCSICGTLLTLMSRAVADWYFGKKKINANHNLPAKEKVKIKHFPSNSSIHGTSFQVITF